MIGVLSQELAYFKLTMGPPLCSPLLSLPALMQSLFGKEFPPESRYDALTLVTSSFLFSAKYFDKLVTVKVCLPAPNLGTRILVHLGCGSHLQVAEISFQCPLQLQPALRSSILEEVSHLYEEHGKSYTSSHETVEKKWLASQLSFSIEHRTFSKLLEQLQVSKQSLAQIQDSVQQLLYQKNQYDKSHLLSLSQLLKSNQQINATLREIYIVLRETINTTFTC